LRNPSISRKSIALPVQGVCTVRLPIMHGRIFPSRLRGMPSSRALSGYFSMGSRHAVLFSHR
jgi:hypothetical protein